MSHVYMKGVQKFWGYILTVGLEVSPKLMTIKAAQDTALYRIQWTCSRPVL